MVNAIMPYETSDDRMIVYVGCTCTFHLHHINFFFKFEILVDQYMCVCVLYIYFLISCMKYSWELHPRVHISCGCSVELAGADLSGFETQISSNGLVMYTVLFFFGTQWKLFSFLLLPNMEYFNYLYSFAVNTMFHTCYNLFLVHTHRCLKMFVCVCIWIYMYVIFVTHYLETLLVHSRPR